MDPPAVIVVALLCAWACACLLPLAAGQDSPAPDITYHVRNEAAGTVVGKRFDQLFGGGRMEQLMSDATAAVWETFEIHHYPENTNFFTDVYLTLKHNLSSVPDQVAGWIDNDNEIVLNSRFFSGPFVRDNGGMEPWVQSTVHHEMTHVWQVYKGYTSKEGRALVEGMASYVSKRAGHPSPECVLWYPLLRSRDWRQGYCIAMYFLRYFYFLGGDAIVAEINRRLNDHGYLEDDFVDLLGSTPDELWQQFLDTLPGPNIGLQQLVAGAGQAGRNKAATTSYIY